MAEPTIAMAASPREWAQALHRHVADHGGARVRATVLHQHDAVAEDHDVFVGDDSTSFLTRHLVEALHERGRAVLGVFDPDDPRGKGELLDMGVDDVIARDADPAEFVAAITALHARTRHRVDAELHALVRGILPQPAAPPAAAQPAPAAPAPVAGPLLVVAGAGGGTGATEVAIAIAQRLGERGEGPALLDADEVAPNLAQRLGLPLYPNLRAAVDLLERRTAEVAEVLAPVPAGGFAVCAGLSTPRSWTELHPAATVEVARELARGPRPVVANAGPRLEDLAAAGGPSRYGASRALVAAADALVVVASPTPVGLARLLEWTADVRVLADGAPLHVVWNRAPGSAFKQGELADELARTTAPAGQWFAPADHRVEAAAWAGSLVAGGPFRRVVGGLADALVPATAPRRRRRVRR